METAYTAFATQVIELCNGGMDMNLTVIALAYIFLLYTSLLPIAVFLKCYAKIAKFSELRAMIA